MTTSEIELKKQSLIQDSQTYSTNIKSELHSINSNLKRVGLTALLAGAALVTTYYLASKIFGKSKSKKQWVAKDVDLASSQVMSMRPASSTPYWFAMVKEQMMLFVLAILKQKLAEYLESIDKEAVMEKITGFFAPKQTIENTKPLDLTIPY